MKPFFSYYGGKQLLAPRIVPILESIPHKIYCEPFAGGLAVFYARGWKRGSRSYTEVINDKSELLINVYRWAREYPEEFEYMALLTPYSEAEYQRANNILKAPDQYSDREKAWAYYLNISQSFSHKLGAGWGYCKVHENKAVTWRSQRHRIPQCLQRLDGVSICCDEALNVIGKFDSSETLFYLDPPYLGASQGHYEGYSLDDWQALCDALDSCQGSYVVSNYPQSIEPASALERIEIQQLMSASGNTKTAKLKTEDKQRTEVLWVCDRSKQGRQRQLSLLEVAS